MQREKRSKTDAIRKDMRNDKIPAEPIFSLHCCLLYFTKMHYGSYTVGNE